MTKGIVEYVARITNEKANLCYKPVIHYIAIRDNDFSWLGFDKNY